MEKRTVLVGGSVLFPEADQFVEANVAIDAKGRIADAGPSVQPEPGDVVIDLGGARVLPGLIDAHIHLGSDCTPNLFDAMAGPPALVALRAAMNARRTLEAGFTSIRNVGECNYMDVHLRDAIEAGYVVGPRVVTCGLGIAIIGGHGHPGSWTVAGPEDCRKAVREHLANRVDQIKAIGTGGVLSKGKRPGASQLTFEELKVIADEAHRAGLMCCVHAHGTQGIREALLAGFDSIEHASLPDEECIQLFLDTGAYLVPTFAAGERIKAHAERLSPEVLSKSLQMAEEKARRFRWAVEAGVKSIALGTDAGSPFNYHGENAQEFVLMVHHGMSPRDAIRAGTEVAAACIGLGDQVGSITPGKWADLVVVDGNPLEDIAVLTHREKIKLVFKGGEIVADRRTEQG